MSKTTKFWLFAVLIALGAVPGGPGVADEGWVLFGRHGGCRSFAEAAARKPIFSGISDPEDLLAKLRAQNVKFEHRDITVETRRVVAISAPELGLDILLAPSSLCRP